MLNILALPERWQKQKFGAKVKVDSDPSNDYMDGYNARERYWKKRLPRVIITGILVGQVLEIAAYLIGR